MLFDYAGDPLRAFAATLLTCNSCEICAVVATRKYSWNFQSIAKASGHNYKIPCTSFRI